jgi:hypothetical protein
LWIPNQFMTFLDSKPDLNISVGGLLFAVEEGASHFDQGQML